MPCLGTVVRQPLARELLVTMPNSVQHRRKSCTSIGIATRTSLGVVRFAVPQATGGVRGEPARGPLARTSREGFAFLQCCCFSCQDSSIRVARCRCDPPQCRPTRWMWSLGEVAQQHGDVCSKRLGAQRLARYYDPWPKSNGPGVDLTKPPYVAWAGECVFGDPP